MSVVVFFAFTSNVTGHYAILAEEISKGNWYQAGIVAGWIFLFFIGSFTSNFIIIHLNRKNKYLAHAIPVFIEIICLLVVGSYIQFAYKETLIETELMVGIMLFAMGIQNGLTASISNSAVKTTHLTGLTTDLGMLFSMITLKRFRKKQQIRGKLKLQLAIMFSYMAGGVSAGYIYITIQYNVFYIVCLFLILVLVYDYSKLRVQRFIYKRPIAMNLHWLRSRRQHFEM